ncbi:MAG: hypothetical protein ACREPD_04870 [Stenotrophomonas sp.]|uniref:hypothetical protein n=1 Tax=Stenotrophomonas sp. TaxID=69392 RepID=UPI003D6CE864
MTLLGWIGLAAFISAFPIALWVVRRWASRRHDRVRAAAWDLLTLSEEQLEAMRSKIIESKSWPGEEAGILLEAIELAKSKRNPHS